jgi:phage-related protein
MKVNYIPAALEELHVLPINERKAMIKAFDKLADFGDQLSYPHSSLVRGSRLRELRPRAGRSPWRALYQRVGDSMVVAAICPEAQQDSRGFRRGTIAAIDRLDQYRKDR